jgi:sulfur-carrier protein adenylyltransferase/sulfurtransferase
MPFETREMENQSNGPRGRDLSDPECPVEEAKKLLESDDGTILIDMRSEGVCRIGHIKGARFVPADRIEAELSGLPDRESARVLIYCSFGLRSLPVAERLRRAGFRNARSIAGGYSGWLRAGGDVITGSGFTPDQLERYSRNMYLKEIGREGQLKLMNAKVLMVGAGGLGSSAALYLAAAGVGTLGIVDFDGVEPSNLNRQILHGTKDIGRPKIESARSSIERINPDANVVPFAQRLVPANALGIIRDFDIVLDGSDNAGTKFLLNDACHLLEKPYVFGGAVGFDGQAGVFWPKQGGPCLRCLFPKPPSPDITPTCSETGVLGVVPGHIGLVQATEVLKLILGAGTPMIGKFYIYNALTLTMQVIEVGRNAKCPLCGENPRITSLTGVASAEYDSGQECRQVASSGPQ